ncbi:uncharacterized protein AAGF69_008993 [Amazona ochrocephala]
MGESKSGRCLSGGCLDTVRSSTTGSAGVDVETAVETTLQDYSVYIIDSNMKGPLGYGLSALLFGRSSTSRQGIFVLPGVIDADYCGIIKIMVYTITPPVLIPQGSRIAQLIPFQSCVPQRGDSNRGEGGFGSTGVPQIKASGGYRLVGYGRGEIQQKISRLHRKMSVMIKNLLVVKLLILLFVYSSVSFLHEINPRKNLWVTWANESGVSEFCLAMASATDPFQTCLIGIPGYNENSFKAFSTNNCSKSTTVADCSAKLISGLIKTLPWDPQELNLMASQVNQHDQSVGGKKPKQLDLLVGLSSL